MRICHVIDYFHTDVAYQEYYLALEQARQGHRVSVITTRYRQHTVSVPVTAEEEARGAEALAEAGVEVVRLDAWQLGHDRAWVRHLGRAIANRRPDAAHVHGPFAPTTVRAVRAAARHGVNVLVDNHIQEAIAPGSTRLAGRAYYGAYRALFAPGLRRAVGRWVANGPYEKRFLTERMGLPTDAVELVPLGFDPAVYTYDPNRRAALRSAWQMGDELVVAVTGKLHAAKRTELVAAAAEAHLEVGPARLVVAGQVDDTVVAEIRRAAPTLAATGRIEIRPMLGRSDLSDLYLAADVVAFPRLPSISIYEAAGTGALVLAPPDDFGRWLTSLHAGIRLFDGAALAGPEDRAGSAAAATEAFAWSSIAARFAESYEAL